MSAPLAVSPLIKTARWSLLLLGVTYGYRKNNKVTALREKERVVENEKVQKYLTQKEEARDRARIEFERDSVLFAKPGQS